MTLSLDISKENCKKTPFQQSSVTSSRTFWQAWIQDSSFRDQNQGGDLKGPGPTQILTLKQWLNTVLMF